MPEYRKRNSAKLMGKEKASTQKAKITPSTRDLEWAAGFLEGEGCFRDSGRPTNPCAEVSATQASAEPITRLLCMFGGAVHYRPSRGKKSSPVWIWKAHGGRARGIVMTLYPLLTARRQFQVRRALGRV